MPSATARGPARSPTGTGGRGWTFLLAALALRPFGEKGLWRTMRFALGPNAHDLAGNDVGALALLIAKHCRHRTESIPTFTEDALRGLTVPLMAVVGGKDAMLDSYETQRRLTASVPHAAVHLLSESGHLLPDQTQTVLRFLCSPAARPD